MNTQKKVLIIAPSPFSLISTTIADILLQHQVEIVGCVIKKFSAKRFFNEYKRDGRRLINKIWNKLFLRQKFYAGSNVYNIIKYRVDKKVTLSGLNQLTAKGCKIIKVQDINSFQSETFIKKFNPDLVIFTGGGLVKENILKISGLGVLNCHMGILPHFRGMDVVEWPILCNHPEGVGITIHLMDKNVDTGGILAIKKIEINGIISFKELRQKFEPIMCEFFVETVLSFLSGKIKPQIQKEEDGNQYFIMEQRLYKKAQDSLRHYSK